ncbi:MAG: hypothetical protein SFW67_06305, partial [Myxococcaceae bacterium]|nr:hypothetical protein [Myxococcaceae bacterium]
MATSRALRIVVAASVATPLLLVAGVFVSAELRGRRLAASLVDEANAQAGWALSRAGEPGSIAECVGRALDAAPDVSRDAPWMSVDLFDVRDGKRPLESLPGTALASLTVNDPWLRETVACTRRSTLEAVAGLGPLAEPLHRRRQALPRLQEAVAALAPLRVRLLSSHGQHDEALTLCAATFALVSDVLWLEGPEASLGALGMAGNLVRPCVDAALATTDDTVAARFDASLAVVESRVPPYAHVMRLERVAQKLRLFGTFFTPAQVTRLPPGAQSMVTTSASLSRRPWERVGLSHWWKACDRGFEGVIAAADLPEPRRTRDILTAQRHFMSPWLRLVAVNPLDVRYEMYAESHEVLPMSLALVRAAVTARHGVPAPTPLIDVTVRDDGIEVAPRQPEWRR